MINHYEMQQMVEAKRMEIERLIEEQSFFPQGEELKERFNYNELFKKLFSKQKDTSCING